MEQCREEIDMNWDMFSWEHQREFLCPPFVLQVAPQFCFSPWLGQGEGMGHYRMGLAVPTAPGQSNTSASLISFALVSAICPLVKQAPSPIPNRNIRLFFPSEKSFQHLHLLKAPAPLTSHSSITRAEEALFPCKVSSPAAGQVLLSSSGFYPAFQQPLKKYKFGPGRQTSQGQAPWHSWCSTGTAKGGNVPLLHCIPPIPPYPSWSCVPH